MAAENLVDEFRQTFVGSTFEFKALRGFRSPSISRMLLELGREIIKSVFDFNPAVRGRRTDGY